MMENRLRRAQRLGATSLADMLAQSRQDRISFAGDSPEAHGTSSVGKEIKQAAERAASFRTGDEVLQTGPRQGLLTLRELLGKRMARRGISADPDEIMITAGQERILPWMFGALIKPGDPVLVETPTHPACLRALKMCGAHTLQAACDQDGMLIDEAERLIQANRPKMIYVMPSLGHPVARVWSQSRREALLELSRRYDIPVLEDDPYGDLLYDEADRQPALFGMNKEMLPGGGVIYRSTFELSVAQELRNGWIVADPSVIAKLTDALQAKASEVVESSELLSQQILVEWLTHSDVDAHLRNSSLSYMERMHQLESLLRRQGWDDASWTEPKGGMFLWLELPEGFDTEALLRATAANGVTFDPGTPFYAADPPRNRVRFNIANLTGNQLEAGVARFAEAVNAFLGRT